MRVQTNKQEELISRLESLGSQATNTEPKKTIHNVFLVDASGSMSGSKYTKAIDGINELIESIKKDTLTDNTLTVVEFEGRSIVQRIKHSKNLVLYKGMGTGGMTPLNQAVGETLEYMLNVRKDIYGEDDKILVNVFTDGLENSSYGKFQDGDYLGSFIKSLEPQGVIVTFLGTKDEVQYAVKTLNLRDTNTLVHQNTAESIRSSYQKTVLSRQAFSKSVSLGEEVLENFYTKSVN